MVYLRVVAVSGVESAPVHPHRLDEWGYGEGLRSREASTKPHDDSPAHVRGQKPQSRPVWGDEWVLETLVDVWSPDVLMAAMVADRRVPERAGLGADLQILNRGEVHAIADGAFELVEERTMDVVLPVVEGADGPGVAVEVAVVAEVEEPVELLRAYGHGVIYGSAGG